MDSFKKKLIFESVVTLLIVVGLFTGIFIFSGVISDYSDQITALRKTIADRSSSLSALASLRFDYNTKVKQDFQILSDAVPVKDQLINLPKEFQLLASQSGLSSSFSFIGEAPASGAGFGTIRFKLDASGDFQKLVGFVDTLQNFRYLSTFDSFSLTRAGTGGQLSTTGQIYYRAQ